jgi:hypothetical protein
MSKISLYTDVFCEQDYHEIWSFLRSNNWSFGHTSNSKSLKRFWSMDFSNNLFFTEHLFGVIKKLIGDNYTIERVYANGQTYGLNGEFHYDCLDDCGYTFLYYPNREWKTDWDGCTVIHEGENIRSFYPLPNTAIMFPGKLLHCGNGPSREFYDLRISIAYKLRLSVKSLTDPATRATIIR